MYLARQLGLNTIQYSIRESYLDGDVFRYRDLLELGTDPHQYIIYADSRTFVIDDWISIRLLEKGVDVDQFELEELFHPFIDPELQYRIDKFANRARHRKWKSLSAELKKRILDETHLCDRRRAHFLRFGQTDQRQLSRTVSIFKVLLDKSRDEIEQYFLKQEMVLMPSEYKNYMFAIFNLQAFFTESFAHTMPEALDLDKMDHHFIDQVCELHSDDAFWRGFDRGEKLNEYLVRYMIMYFDYSFATGTGWEQYVRNFMDSKRQFVPPKSSKRMSMSEVATVFGVSRAKLAEMDSGQLKRLFRKKARELHPDQGGDHEAFIELASAYQEISRTKVKKR